MRYPPKPVTGDRVAIVSPSAGLPGLYPDVYELGLSRLRTHFGLEPVEFPTTRRMDASAADRAADLHAAFADATITAVLASIGGSDEITVLRHLDDDLLRANPKPFFGYSDNTNLCHHLWKLGLVSYHGGSVMVHLGRPGRIHPAHEASLRAALFDDGWYQLDPPEDWTDEHTDWADVASLTREPAMSPSGGWDWVGADRVVQAPAWGGNIEILSWLAQADLLPANEAVEGCVAFLETSEEMPAPEEVFRILRNLGERGLLARFPAVLVGRPKAWDSQIRQTPAQKRAYSVGLRDAFTRALAAYNPSAMVVFDLDIGHTDPQLIVPYGGTIRVDGPARQVHVRY